METTQSPDLLHWLREVVESNEITWDDVLEGFPLVEVLSMLSPSAVDLSWYHSEQARECLNMSLRNYVSLKTGLKSLKDKTPLSLSLRYATDQSKLENTIKLMHEEIDKISEAVLDAAKCGEKDACKSILEALYNIWNICHHESNNQDQEVEYQHVSGVAVSQPYIPKEINFRPMLRWLLFTVQSFLSNSNFDSALSQELNQVLKECSDESKVTVSSSAIKILCRCHIYNFLDFFLMQGNSFWFPSSIMEKSETPCFTFLDSLIEQRVMNITQAILESITNLVTDESLFSESIHSNIIGAFMQYQINQTSIENIVEYFERTFIGYDRSLAFPFDVEDALLLWINQCLQTLKCDSEIEDLSDDLDDVWVLGTIMMKYFPACSATDNDFEVSEQTTIGQKKKNLEALSLMASDISVFIPWLPVDLISATSIQKKRLFAGNFSVVLNSFLNSILSICTKENLKFPARSSDMESTAKKNNLDADIRENESVAILPPILKDEKKIQRVSETPDTHKRISQTKILPKIIETEDAQQKSYLKLPNIAQRESRLPKRNTSSRSSYLLELASPSSAISLASSSIVEPQIIEKLTHRSNSRLNPLEPQQPRNISPVTSSSNPAWQAMEAPGFFDSAIDLGIKKTETGQSDSEGKNEGLIVINEMAMRLLMDDSADEEETDNSKRVNSSPTIPIAAISIDDLLQFYEIQDKDNNFALAAEPLESKLKDNYECLGDPLDSSVIGGGKEGWSNHIENGFEKHLDSNRVDCQEDEIIENSGFEEHLDSNRINCQEDELKENADECHDYASNITGDNGNLGPDDQEGATARKSEISESDPKDFENPSLIASHEENSKDIDLSRDNEKNQMLEDEYFDQMVSNNVDCSDDDNMEDHRHEKNQIETAFEETDFAKKSRPSTGLQTYPIPETDNATEELIAEESWRKAQATKKIVPKLMKDTAEAEEHGKKSSLEILLELKEKRLMKQNGEKEQKIMELKEKRRIQAQRQKEKIAEKAQFRSDISLNKLSDRSLSSASISKRPQSAKRSQLPVKSNKPIVKNALMHVCLAGNLNKVVKEEVLQDLAESDAGHFVILFRDVNNFTFRGLYFWDHNLDQTLKLYSGCVGPTELDPRAVLEFYKYDSGARTFKTIPTKSFGRSVDAVAIGRGYFIPKGE